MTERRRVAPLPAPLPAPLLVTLPVTLAVAAAAVLPAAPAAAEPFRYGLNWLPQAEHCGFFQALADGSYAEAGLEVEIVSGGPDVNVALLVGAGELDAGMGSSFTTLNMVDQGVEAKTVAALFQKDPQTLVAHAGQGVENLADLAERPIMVANFSRGEFWQFLKAEHGFTDDQLRPYSYNAAVFLSDPTAVQQGYVTEDGLFLGAEMDDPPVILLLADFGYENYATTIFATDAVIEGRTEDLQAFVDATIAGYETCLTGDASAAMEIVMDRNPDHSEALWDYKLGVMRERALVDGGAAAENGIGTMTEARWQSFFDTMVAAGVYDADLPLEEAYTLEFVD
ncbi:MAG: ABC transporter substrate-binding protein [Alphaproteobacteria bacterium]|nr:ABC transporter substrate-binding protein [Alphaproteobacteria bacterium]